MSRVCTAALDRAAEIISAALDGVAVARMPIGADEPDIDADDVGLIVAVSETVSTQTGYCMGASRPFEFEHGAALEVLAIGGSDEKRRARTDAALEAIEAAIASDPTLGGQVDHAEVVDPDPAAEPHYVAIIATLTLTYTAPSALG